MKNTMSTFGIIFGLLAMIGVVLLAGCGGGASSAPPPPPSPPPAPSISSISPSSAIAGGAGFTLTVNGSNFVSGAAVQWNGSNRPTTFVGSTQLTAAIPAGDLAAAGTAQVSVANPASNASTSNSTIFTILLVQNPTPTLSSLDPSSAFAGGPAFTLTLNGSNFVSGAELTWNGFQSIPANFVSSTKLTVLIPAELIASATPYSPTGLLNVWVNNPSPGGGESNALLFTINNPVPSISSLSPSGVTAGAAPFLLTVNGSNFVAGTTVEWSGSSRPTTFVNSTQVVAAIPASDVTAAGSAQVTAINPAPTAGPSSAFSFTVSPLSSNPAPTISSLSVTSAPAGWLGFPLGVHGTGFVAASVLQWNGLNRVTTVLSSTGLVAAIPASDLSTAATAQVTVFNPSPGGGSSSANGFTIKPVAPDAVGVIEQASISTGLSEADGDSFNPTISADGRFVAFSSTATNLVLEDTNGISDVFLRDTCLGALPGCTPSMTRVSLSNSGNQTNGNIFGASISANGRFVAFSSDGNNVLPDGSNGFADVYVRDTCNGAPAACMPSTVRASFVDSPHLSLLENTSPTISSDGRFVAFLTDFPQVDCCGFSPAKIRGPAIAVPNNAPLGSYSFEVDVRDTCAGAPASCKPTNYRVGVHPDGTGSAAADSATISGNGRYVAFSSIDHMLVPGDTSNKADVFVGDTCKGAPANCQPATVRVSVAGDGSQSNDDSKVGAITSDGRFVSFISRASNLVTGASGPDTQVYVRDTCVGAPADCHPSTVQVSVASDGTSANGASQAGSLSANGRFVSFSSDASNLVPGDTNQAADVFVRDTCVGASPGCKPSTVRVSVATDGTQGNGTSGGGASINADGRFLVFASRASNLGPGKTNHLIDLFLARTGL